MASSFSAWCPQTPPRPQNFQRKCHLAVLRCVYHKGPCLDQESAQNSSKVAAVMNALLRLNVHFQMLKPFHGIY